MTVESGLNIPKDYTGKNSPSMQYSHTRILVVLFLVLVLYVLPTILLWSLAFHPPNNMSETMCLVIESNVKSRTFNYSCECSDDSKCKLCNFTYFDGVITATYYVKNKPFFSSITVYFGEIEAWSVNMKLNSNYPIGRKVECVYSKENPSNVKEFQPNDVAFIFFMLFLFVGPFCILGYMCKFCDT